MPIVVDTVTEYTSGGGVTIEGIPLVDGGFGGTLFGVYGTPAIAQPSALTAPVAGSANSGDATTDAVIEALLVRLSEIETALSAVGIIGS